MTLQQAYNAAVDAQECAEAQGRESAYAQRDKDASLLFDLATRDIKDRPKQGFMPAWVSDLVSRYEIPFSEFPE